MGGNSFTLLDHTCRGGTPARSSQPGGGVPPIGPGQELPPAGGYPTSGNPPSDLAGSTPPWVPPCWIWQGGTPLPGGYPTLGTPIRPGWGGTSCQRVPHLGYPPGRGYPCRGPPHLRYTPHQTLPGGIPPAGGGYPTSGNRWSTWYAAVGMPLVFTQEDFLVLNKFNRTNRVKCKVTRNYRKTVFFQFLLFYFMLFVLTFWYAFLFFKLNIKKFFFLQ